MSLERDGRRTSRSLTHARNVLGHVENALRDSRYWMMSTDPAAGEIKDLLQDTQRLLEPYRRTGPTKKEDQEE